MKDTLEKVREPNLNLTGVLQSAYVHPVFKGGDDSDGEEVGEEERVNELALVPTKRQQTRPATSKRSGSLTSLLPEDQEFS